MEILITKLSKLIVIVYTRTALFENQMNLKKLRILIPWSIVTNPKIYIIENQSGFHNNNAPLIYELTLTNAPSSIGNPYGSIVSEP
jgi:hypothetical protein